MPKIPLYPSSVAPNDDDLLILEDSVTSNTKKIKRSDLLGGNTITATNGIVTDDISAISATGLTKIYPVGSIYMNASVATNPGTLLGFGTWTEFGAGRVPVGKAAAGTFDTAGSTGGAETHSLTANQNGPHTHSFYTNASGGTVGNNATFGGTDSVANGAMTSSGLGTAHNNLQPYIVVYMWVRTA